MKKYIFRSHLILISLFLSFSSGSCIVCGMDYIKTTKSINLDNEFIVQNIRFSSIKPINYIDKMYIYKNYILINEKDMGFHVVDNQNPENPEQLGFLKIPFTKNIVINNNTLFANILDKFVSIDISDIKNLKLIDKVNIKSNELDNKKITIGYKEVKEIVNNCPKYPPFLGIYENPDIPNNNAYSPYTLEFKNNKIYANSDKNINLLEITKEKKIINKGEIILKEDIKSNNDCKIVNKIGNSIDCDLGNSDINKIDISEYLTTNNSIKNNFMSIIIDNIKFKYIYNELKVITTTEEKTVLSLNNVLNINSNNKNIIFLTSNGLYQYDISGLYDNKTLKKISYLPLIKTFSENGTIKIDNIEYYKWYKEYIEN